MNTHPRTTGRARLGAMLSAAALILTATAACGSGSSSSDGDELVVGALLAMTGPNAQAGATGKAGALARYKEENEAGGINGHKIVLEVGDDQLDPAKAPGVARQLVESDKVLVITGGGSADSYAILPYLKAKKVLAIPGGGSGALIQEEGTTYRQTIPGYDLLAASTVDYAVNTLGKKRVAIAYTPDAVGEPTRDGAVKMLKKLGMEPVAEVAYSASATSAASQAAKLKASGADFVVINHVPAVASVVMKANEKLGFRPDYGSSYALRQPNLIELMGEGTLDGRVYFATHHALPESPEAAKFKAACDKVKGCDYTVGDTMTGYIAADAAVEALKAAVEANDGKVPTSAQVLAATKNLKMDTSVNRQIEWSSTKFTGSPQAQIVSLKGGKYVSVQGFQDLPAID